MRFYEIRDPYYALIKAGTVGEAIELYVDEVADDEGDGAIQGSILEVHRDLAAAIYSRTPNSDGVLAPIAVVVADIQSDDEMVLAMDGSLA